MSTIPNPTPDAPTPARRGRRSWRSRALEAVNACIEPMGTFSPGWEARWYDPDENEWEADLLSIAPAFARVESNDDRDGDLVWNPFSIVEVSDLTRLLGADSQVWLEQRDGAHVGSERKGTWITGNGRFSRRELYVEIRCDRPFEDARPRQIAHFGDGQFGYSDIEDEDNADDEGGDTDAR